MALNTETEPRRAEWLEPPEEEQGLKRYVETIRERIWLVITSILITTAAAGLYVATAPKTYEAEAQLLITPVSGDASALAGLGVLVESSDPTRDVETAARLVDNREIAELAKERLGTEDGSGGLLDRVSAEPVAQSSIVAVTATGDSPEEARDLANAFAEATVEDRTASFQREVEARITQLENSLAAEGATGPLAEELAQIQALRGAPSPDFRLETAADAPTSPASPRPLLSLAGGLFAGLVLGIGGAFASQALDPRLRREEQLRRLYRLPILARIPREPSRGSRHEPLGPRAISAAGAEAYRTLRATLTSERNNTRGSQAIVVTGPSAGDGKSTTAINLASSLALAGKRVILIEADLRRPSLGSALGINAPAGGVVSVLIENTRLEDALIPTPTYGPNLRLLLADYEGGWITELFSIPAAEQMIQDARSLADVVVIDSPPISEVVDSLPLARRADDVLIVVRLGKTRLDQIAKLAELLAENEIKPVGFTVVGTPRPSRGQYHYYTGAEGAPGTGSERMYQSSTLTND
jgi:polysaccharide biosynthesis transport protein